MKILALRRINRRARSFPAIVVKFFLVPRVNGGAERIQRINDTAIAFPPPLSHRRPTAFRIIRPLTWLLVCSLFGACLPVQAAAAVILPDAAPTRAAFPRANFCSAN